MARAVINTKIFRKWRNVPHAKIMQRVPRIQRRMEANRTANEELISKRNLSPEWQRTIRNATNMDSVSRRVEAVKGLGLITQYVLPIEMAKRQNFEIKGVKDVGPTLTLNDITGILQRCRTDPDPEIVLVAKKALDYIKKESAPNSTTNIVIGKAKGTSRQG